MTRSVVPLTGGHGPRFPSVSEPKTANVPLDTLVLAGSPRLSGEDLEHTSVLAGIENELPPIVVHRPTMRVLDGVHRVRAAMMRGDSTIQAMFFDGTAEEAYVLAVRSNVTHGLPLTVGDRKAAAIRIIGIYPHWSDRAIASAAGLAAKTVAGLRPSADRPVDRQRSDTRLGRDGRLRPVRTAEGRRRAQQMILDQPEASLREVARFAGVSPETVRDVRTRMARGEDPVARRVAGPAADRARAGAGPADGDNQSRDLTELLTLLKRDPALRFSDVGRSVLRWIDAQHVVSSNWSVLADRVPPHCAGALAELAAECSQSLQLFAEQLKQRSVDG